jgi:hypothetical protein
LFSEDGDEENGVIKVADPYTMEIRVAVATPKEPMRIMKIVIWVFSLW